MINDLYNDKILKLASNITRDGRLDTFDFTSVAVSKLCGSKVTVDVKITNNLISDFSHIVKACALGQASSAVMADNIIGSNLNELKNLQDLINATLRVVLILKGIFHQQAELVILYIFRCGKPTHKEFDILYV